MANAEQRTKVAKQTYGRCQAVPRPTAKEQSGQCPRTVMTQNEHGLCGSHLTFLKRGAEIKLQSGTVLNPKSQAAEPEKKVVSVEVIGPAPEQPLAVAPKKLGKRAKVQQALEIIRQKDAQKATAAVAAQTPSAMINRSLPDGQ